MVREGRVFIAGTGSKPDFGSSYSVQALEVGAQVASGSSGTTITVRAGHGFAAGDKYMKSLDASTYSGTNTVQSVTATTVVVQAAYSVSAGDLIINLGPDTGTSAPNYDGNGLTIYTDMDYTTSATNATVSAGSTGRYTYYHKGINIWELVRSGSTLIALYTNTIPNSVYSSTAFDGSDPYSAWYTAELSSVLPGFPTTPRVRGPVFNKLSTGDQGFSIGWARDSGLKWALGEDYRTGNSSYFAIWHYQGDPDGAGNWTSGDIFGISPAGSDTLGVEGCKWNFNSAFSPDVGDNEYDQNYYFGFFQNSNKSSGTGPYTMYIGCNGNTAVTSGGVRIDYCGIARPGLVVNQLNTSYRYGAIQVGRYSGASFLGFELGCDIPKANTNTFSIYDVASSAYRMHILSNGDVGMGTTTAGRNLHVYESTDGDCVILSENPNTGTSARAGFISLAGSVTGTLTSWAATYSDAAVAGSTTLFTGTSTKLHLGTASTKRVTILDTAAKVGIGVDPPVEALQVVGCVAANGDAVSGVANYVTYTGTSSLAAAGATFTVKGVSGATARDSAGFIKIWIGTTAYYVPVFSAITG